MENLHVGAIHELFTTDKALSIVPSEPMPHKHTVIHGHMRRIKRDVEHSVSVWPIPQAAGIIPAKAIRRLVHFAIGAELRRERKACIRQVL